METQWRRIYERELIKQLNDARHCCKDCLTETCAEAARHLEKHPCEALQTKLDTIGEIEK